MLLFLLRIFCYLVSFSVVAAGGLYGYVALQKAVPAPETAFFVDLPKRPLVIAHRGGGGQFPENTLHAFHESAKLGVDILELDIHETADRAIVVLHDRTVDRTTNGSGEIRLMTLVDAQKLDAAYDFSTDGGASHPLRGKGIGIPALEEVLEALPDQRFNIEMKHASETMPSALCSLLRARSLLTRVIVASANEENLERFRSACPEVSTSGSFSEVTKFLVHQSVGLAGSFSPAMNVIQTPVRLRGFEIVNARYVEEARKLNLRVHGWTINDPEEMKRLIEMGVDGIMTDYPERLFRVARER